LLDSAGRLIGVNTSIYSPSGASVGIGFAVPVDTVNRIVPQIIRTGRVYRPLLGFTIVDPATATQVLGVEEGVVVNQVIDGSGAQAAGVRPLAQGDDGSYAFDVVLQVADRQVRALDDVYRELDGREFGQVVPVRIRRLGSELTLDVELRRYTQ
jgi:S1-C subfamily serine protease